MNSLLNHHQCCDGVGKNSFCNNSQKFTCFIKFNNQLSFSYKQLSFYIIVFLPSVFYSLFCHDGCVYFVRVTTVILFCIVSLILLYICYVLMRFTAQLAMLSAVLAIVNSVRPSDRLSVCHTLVLSQNDSSCNHGVFTVGQPHDSSFLVVNFGAKFQREPRERGRQMRMGQEKQAIFSQ